MNILHVVAGDLSGGAARGAYWLHLALLKKNIDSNILTNSINYPNKKKIYSLSKTIFYRILLPIKNRSAEISKLKYINRNSHPFNTGFDGIDITKNVLYKNADIVNFHWINGLVNIDAMKKINKPLVWTIRDMWPMTGGCHHVNINCERFKKKCGLCPHLNSKKFEDLSYKILQNKIKSYPLKNLTIVGISNWILQKAKNSNIFKNVPIHLISNGLDQKVFFPTEKKKIKKKFNLPSNCKILLVGAQDLSDSYKGFDLFLESLKKIKSLNIHILSFGEMRNLKIDGFNHTNLGFIKNDKLMREIYSAADAYISPSLIESFGKSVLEAMACGTPSVIFDNTGSTDIVTHKIDGYVSKFKNTTDLAKGIDWVLNTRNNKKLSKNAIRKVTTKFNINQIAADYKKLYINILKKY